MPILMDQILTEYAYQAYEAAHLRRKAFHRACDLVSAELIAELEMCGNAMRFVDANGRIGWKATPGLRQHLKDLELDAHDDLADI